MSESAEVYFTLSLKLLNTTNISGWWSRSVSASSTEEQSVKCQWNMMCEHILIIKLSFKGTVQPKMKIISQTLIIPDELHVIVFVFFISSILKQVPSYFCCLGDCCNAVLLLQKCFGDYETSCNNDQILIFGWTVPLTFRQTQMVFSRSLEAGDF